MFLSRYHDEELGPEEEDVPEDLWFSNQVCLNGLSFLIRS